MADHAKDAVFVTRPFPGDGLDRLERAVGQIEVFSGDEGADRETLLDRASRCTGLITMLSDRIDAALLNAAPRLKVVAQYAVGFDNIDVAEATKRGICVTNTPDVLTDATAELAVALMFAAARRLSESDRYVREGRFHAWLPGLMLGVTLKGKTLGILGAGRIGQAVGERAAGLGMNVIYCDGDRGSREAFEAATGARAVSFEDMLDGCDVLSLHVPLTEGTRAMIGPDELARMKPGAILVNTSRGPVVNEAALAEALASGRLRAAGLDVYEREPEVEPALLSLPNVVLAPHIGSATEEARGAMGDLAVHGLLSVLAGERPDNLVDDAVWERRRA